MTTQREEQEFKIVSGKRVVTVRTMNIIGVEDCYENLINAVLHRYATGEDVVPVVPREVKDFILKQTTTI